MVRQQVAFASLFLEKLSALSSESLHSTGNFTADAIFRRGPVGSKVHFTVKAIIVIDGFSSAKHFNRHVSVQSVKGGFLCRFEGMCMSRCGDEFQAAPK